MPRALTGKDHGSSPEIVGIYERFQSNSLNYIQHLMDFFRCDPDGDIDIPCHEGLSVKEDRLTADYR